MARHWYGLLLARIGRYEEALAQSRAALELDPLSPIISQDVGFVLQLAGERDASLRQYARTVEMHPDFSTTVLVLAMTYMLHERFDDAAATLSQWARVTERDTLAVREVAELAARFAATQTMQEPAGIELESVFPPFIVAPFYVLLGDYESAVDYFERG